jgi:hypothetical protein
MNARAIRANADPVRREEHRRTIYEIAEAMLRAGSAGERATKEVTAPVREWMIRELAPRPSTTG